MAWWAWVLCALGALLGLGLLALALFRVRYRLEWRGEWGGLSSSQEGSIEFRYGFPGFTKTWNPLEDDDWTFPNPFDIDDDEDEKTVAAPFAGPGDPFPSEENASRIPGERVEPVGKPEYAEGAERAERVEPLVQPPRTGAREEPYFLNSGKPDAPARNGDRAARKGNPHQDDAAPKQSRRAAPDRSKKDPNRKRRALFRFITDPDVWKFFARYGVRCVQLLFGLLKPRAEGALGHPDPVRLGRLAGKWYAVRPFLPLGDTVVHFRFQDRHPTLWLKAEGGFSLLSVLGFGLRLLLAFPLIRFGLGALRGWRHHRLTGWRAWIYRRLQTR